MRDKRRIGVGLAAALLAAVALVPGEQGRAAAEGGTRVLFHDDFRSGFDTVGSWALLPTPGPNGTTLVAGDGVTSTSAGGLYVRPTGTNPSTGRPAFAASTGRQTAGGGGSDADHIKWLAYENRVATTGLPGFDIPATGALNCSATVSATASGVDQQPFGDRVADPQSDPRLASASLIAADFGSSAIADLAVTNTEVYAVYERLRTPGSTWASYSYVIPVARRTPHRRNTLRIRYDQGGSRVTWFVDGRQVLSTDRIGYRAFDRRYMVLDHGGTEEPLAVRETICGLGTGDELDGAGADGRGLVELDSTPGYYYDPRLGEPAPQSFADPASLPGSRLWGQGITLSVGSVDVRTTGTSG
ncbi:DUF6081 family protein [Streptomyces polygonati]|uniref:DUF6081 family protein n=1 Tax=Streptomyces polygonati TaxID=1617087 RepID=A0ABV8HI46_9ACTN